jgi:hypothetical protein
VEDAPAPRPDGLRRALWRRLPILAAIAVGLWLWQGGAGLFPRTRALVWVLPADRADVREVEILLRAPDGALLKREQFFFFERAPPAQLRQQVPLPDGEFPATVLLRREGGRLERREKVVRTVGAEEVELRL